MKPNFALNLSHDGIALLHRGPNGWYTMGEVALDDPDMGNALARLRALATAISPKGLTTKLVIPNSQILYRTITDPCAATPDTANSTADRIRAIRTSLEGATPYALDELVWDWRCVGEAIQLAVVARDTLAEAEAFANEYRFNPISYVALPDANAFAGEPFFGRAQSADALIGATVAVEPDLDAIVVRTAPPPVTSTAHDDSEAAPVTSPDVSDAENTEAAPDNTEASDTDETTPETGVEAAPDTAAPEAETETETTPEATDTPETPTATKREAAPSDVPASDVPASDAQAPDAQAPDVPDAKADAAPDAVTPPATPPPLSAFRTHREAAPATNATSGSADTQDRIREQASRLFGPHPTPSPPVDKTAAQDQANGANGSTATDDAAEQAQTGRPEQEQTHVAVTDPDLPTFDPTPAASTKAKPAPKVNRSAPLPEPLPMPAPPRGILKVGTPQTPPAKVAPHVPLSRPVAPSGPATPLSAAADKMRSQNGAAEPRPSRTATPSVPNGAVARTAAPHTDAPAPFPAPTPVVTPVSGGMSTSGEPSIADISDVIHADTIEAPRPDNAPSRAARIASGLARGAATTALSAATGARRTISAGITRQKAARSARRDAARETADAQALAATATAGSTPQEALPAAAPDDMAAPAGKTPSEGPILPVQDATTEAESLTVFGARRRNNDRRGKPRYMGLTLTVLLLALLGLVYIWASFLPEDTADVQTGAVDAATGPTTTIIANDLPAEPSAPVNEGTDETTDEVGEADEIDADIADAAVPELADEALPDSLAGEATRLSLKDVQDHYATTGVWTAAPQGGTANDSDALDDLYIASIDPQILSQDAIALPDALGHTAEDLPRPMLSPVPLNTTFDLDERGLVRATPEGALSPEGVLVFAGRPAVVPRPRPERAATAPVVVDENDPARLALKAFVPQPRPEQLIENNERANLGGITRAQLAAFRPSPRPASPQQEAQEDAEAVGEAAPVATAPRVATSLMPRARPANIEKLATAARAATAAAALVTEQSTTTNSAATRVTAQVPATTLPRTAPTSVANAATVKNQLNLRQLNLMGVYGSSSDRRALLRLPSGRFAKVKVGDSVNGGRVQSITSDALTYVKGGRSTTLKVGG